MLRCRKCRRRVVELACVSMGADEGSAAACSVWHVDVDKLPEWILTSVNQAQWTTGKLNCYNCGARLGGFNFISHSECPCGQDTTVHLSKRRMDYDYKPSFLIIQPPRTRPGKGETGLLTDGPQSKEERPKFTGTELESLQLNYAAAMSHMNPPEVSEPLTESKNTQPFAFGPLNCISCRRDNLEADEDFTSCFFSASPADSSAVDSVTFRSPLSYPAGRQSDTDGEASSNIFPCCSAVSGDAPSPLRERMPQSAEFVESFVDSTAVLTEVADLVLSLGSRSPSDRASDLEEEVLPQTSVGSTISIRHKRREKNRLKNERRKQRRRERWLNSRLEEEQDGSRTCPPLESEEEEEGDAEGLTCAVCLDVYFSPYSCQPCGHIFCEPCVRTLTRNHPTRTPCPMCRAVIWHTRFHQELNQTAKTSFPKLYLARKQSFHNSSCARRPLPGFCRTFPNICGYLRDARMHLVHGGLSLVALNLSNMWDWLLDSVASIHLTNWILVFLFMCALLFAFF